MGKALSAVCVLSLASALMLVESATLSAHTTVNNILSPFTTIQVVPGHHRAYRPPTLWVHNPRYHQRCYRQWDGHYGNWSMYCVRMRYWGHEPHWD